MTYYESYRSTLIQFEPFQDRFVIGADEYLKLVDSIKRGFRFSADCPIVLSTDDHIMDGQHRLSAALHVYGSETVVTFVTRRVVPIEGNRFVVSRDGRPAKIVTGFTTDPASSLLHRVGRLLGAVGRRWGDGETRHDVRRGIVPGR